jgi:hypothetical protein
MHQFLKSSFGIELYVFQTGFLSIKSSTVYTAIGGGIRILIQLASSQHNLYDIYLLLCIQY